LSAATRIAAEAGLDKAIVAAVSRERSARPRRRAAQRRARLATIGRSALPCKIFAAEFPAYGAVNPLPMTAKEIQAQLSDDEAMRCSRSRRRESGVCADAGSDGSRSRLSEALAHKVAAFRRGLTARD
jgi:hypothetical protein